MGFSNCFNLVPVLVSLSILFSLSFVQSGIKATSLIRQVCATNVDPSLCTHILSSAPGASTADAKRLCYISIDLAVANAKQTLSYLKSLVKQTNDSYFKEGYVDCCGSYSGAIDEAEGSKELLAKGDIDSVLFAASGGLDAPRDCDDFFNGEQGPPGPPAPRKLTAANAKAQVYFGIFVGAAYQVKKS